MVSVRTQVRLREAGHLEIAFRCPKEKKKKSWVYSLFLYVHNSPISDKNTDLSLSYFRRMVMPVRSRHSTII